MSPTAPLEDLKRDLAQLEGKRTGSPREAHTAEGARGREAEHPGQPDRDKPQWRWVSPDAIVATILWIIASIGFTVYVANFNR